MRTLAFSLILILSSCHSQSRESMQKEYDSVVKMQKFYETYIDALEPSTKSRREEDALFATKQIDSLRFLKDKMENRRKELAESLFK
jgi:hypothetical protein